MSITIKLNDETQKALQVFIEDNHQFNNLENASEFLLQKILRDLGYLTPTPTSGTTPDKLNSSNDD